MATFKKVESLFGMRRTLSFVLAIVFLTSPIPSSGTTVVTIITPVGIVIASDSGSDTHTGDHSTNRKGTTTKLAVVQGHIVVASIGTSSIDVGKTSFYDFHDWIKMIAGGLPGRVSVADLATIIQKQSAATFANNDEFLDRGILKQEKPLEKYEKFVEYVIAGYSDGRPEMYVVQFYIDWNSKKFVGPIRTLIPSTSKTDGGYQMNFFGVTQALDDLKNERSWAYKHVAANCTAFQTMMRGEVITMDEADAVARAFVETEEEVDPSEVFGAVGSIRVLLDGSVSQQAPASTNNPCRVPPKPKAVTVDRARTRP
jgi:hypothetical protein